MTSLLPADLESDDSWLESAVVLINQDSEAVAQLSLVIQFVDDHFQVRHASSQPLHPKDYQALGLELLSSIPSE